MDLQEWQQHPLSKLLLSRLLDKRDDLVAFINIQVLQTKSLKDIDLHELSEYRGQIVAVEDILAIEEFLKQPVEEDDAEVYSDRPSSNY